MDTVVCCRVCSLVQRQEALAPGMLAECARCGARLAEHKPNSLSRTAAFTLAALAFYVGKAARLYSNAARSSWRSSLVTGGIAFASPEEGELAREGTLFLLHDKPQKEWLDWRPKITIPAGD